MGIWASWQDIGLTANDKPDWSVYSYKDGFANWYPCRSEAKPAAIDLAHIPGYCGPGNRDVDQVGEVPVRPFLRIGISADNHLNANVTQCDTATEILKVSAVRQLRDCLDEWLGWE